MQNLPFAKYPFTRHTLYSIAASVHISLELPANLAKFEDNKPGKYTPPFILGLKNKLTNAINLPDDIQISSIHETLRVELVKLGFTCCDNFQVIKGYIDDGFSEDVVKIKYKEAGMDVYDAASHKNWEMVESLNKKMGDFILAYPTQLTAGYMPPAFSAKVTGDASAFSTKYATFKSTRQTGVATGAKIEADNIVYSDLQRIQKDAHIVFREDPETLKQFVILEVKNIVSPAGGASLGIDLIAEGTNLPVANALIIIQSATGIAMQTTPNDKGEANFDKIDSDTYNVKIQVPGKPDINLVKDVDTGVSARLKITIP